MYKIKKFEKIAETITFVNTTDYNEILTIALSEKFNNVENVQYSGTIFNLEMNMIVIEFENVSFLADKIAKVLESVIVVVEGKKIKLLD